jgi:hypothetical protein
MGNAVIYPTKNDTQLTDLCFLQLGVLLPPWHFQQSCTHKPCWVYVGRAQHLLAKTTPDLVIKKVTSLGTEPWLPTLCLTLLPPMLS